MRVLAMDTASRTCSVAVIEGQSILAEINERSGETHSRHLMKIVGHVLDLSRCSIHNLDGLAVTMGPGSFTGLRIGISTVKGLSFASGKPIVGISALDALAFQFANPSILIAVWLDARKNEVYCSRYRCEKQTLKKIGEDRVLSPEHALDGIIGPCLFLGNGASKYRDIIHKAVGDLAYFGRPDQNAIRASAVGLLSVHKFEANQVENLDTFVPYYIRKPDAEIKLKAGKTKR
jgi:tRNA threonylcarbamoyladenosine biosynthesis protein TsaB